MSRNIQRRAVTTTLHITGMINTRTFPFIFYSNSYHKDLLKELNATFTSMAMTQEIRVDHIYFIKQQVQNVRCGIFDGWFLRLLALYGARVLFCNWSSKWK